MRLAWGERAWATSSAVGLAASAALLALSVADEVRRRRYGVDGALKITTQGQVVLKVQMTAYFALCLLASAARGRGERIRLLVLGNLVLTSAVLYRARVRQQLLAWSFRRNRRAGDHHPEAAS